MAILDDLIAQISDIELRNRISKEVGKLTSKKKFGLVYEEHIPECTPLYDVKIKRGSNIALKDGKINDIYTVKSIKDGIVNAVHRVSGEEKEFVENDVVAVAQFGEPIYPYLKPIDTVKNDPDGDLWHILIEADNYHALQLLAYLYPHQVDCIYIDPPYNTGARDWKYNNDYVDSSDSYRHSKWLSFIEKRLRLAKQLLNPDNSVLIVTIDEKEYLHLGMLLENMFPEANIQMISSVISRKGAARLNEFTRVNEFVFYVMFGNYTITPLDDAEYALEGEGVHWQSFRRSSATNIRTSRPRQFYPIYVNTKTNKIEKVGDSISHDIDRFSVEQIPECDAVFPVRDDGTEMLWGVTPDACRNLVAKGYIRATKRTPNKPQLYVMQYLMAGTIQSIEDGTITIKGYADDGSIIAENLETRKIMPRTQWNNPTHDSRDYGTKILKNVIGELRFDFPKSLYATKDAIEYFLASKPNAIVLDFFAGSGTTLHAINLLNFQDNGKRKCIIVTNNEVSDNEAKALTRQGHKTGDNEWEKLGIARYVTWPRTVCSIEGHDVNGNPLKGNYLGSDLPMADGFKANVAYFKLGFLDKNNVSLGRQFREMLPLLWMKAGGHHECPTLKQGPLPEMLIYPKNRFAVLVDETAYSKFQKEVNAHSDVIETVYIITDSQAGYREMIKGLSVDRTYQLYRDYLDNFRINTGR